MLLSVGLAESSFFFILANCVIVSKIYQGNADEEFISIDSYMYMNFIKIFVNFFWRGATTPVLPIVKMEYGDEKCFKF